MIPGLIRARGGRCERWHPPGGRRRSERVGPAALVGWVGAHRLHRGRVRAVGQDRRSRGRGRRSRPGASPGRPRPGRRAGQRARRRLPAALPERAGPTRHPSVDRRGRPGSARVRRGHAGPRAHHRGGRLSASPRRPPAGVRSVRVLRPSGRRVAIRDVRPGRARSAAGRCRRRRAAGRHPERPRLAFEPGAPRPGRPAAGGSGDRPSCGHAHDPQPRLPRLDPRRRPRASSDSGPATGSSRRGRSGSTCCGMRSSEPSSSTRSAPASRPRR